MESGIGSLEPPIRPPAPTYTSSRVLSTYLKLSATSSVPRVHFSTFFRCTLLNTSFTFCRLAAWNASCTALHWKQVQASERGNNPSIPVF